MILQYKFKKKNLIKSIKIKFLIIIKYLKNFNKNLQLHTMSLYNRQGNLVINKKIIYFMRKQKFKKIYQ